MAVTACGLGDQLRMIAVPRRCHADPLRARTSSSTARTARNGVSVASTPVLTIRAATEPGTESLMRTTATTAEVAIRSVELASSSAGGSATGRLSSDRQIGRAHRAGERPPSAEMGTPAPVSRAEGGFLATPEQARGVGTLRPGALTGGRFRIVAEVCTPPFGAVITTCHLVRGRQVIAAWWLTMPLVVGAHRGRPRTPAATAGRDRARAKAGREKPSAGGRECRPRKPAASAGRDSRSLLMPPLLRRRIRLEGPSLRDARCVHIEGGGYVRYAHNDTRVGGAGVRVEHGVA
jgi:hypothetical protein